MSDFTYQGRGFDYMDHPYNTTRLNERAVELPIARSFVGAQAARGHLRHGLEVGNVLGHYRPGLHRVVDRYEEAPGVDNVDVFDVTGEYPWIVAVSTLEHVRWDEPHRDPSGAIAALFYLLTLLTEEGRLLLTVPLGHHPNLDEMLEGEMAHARRGDLHTVYERDGDGWREADGWPHGTAYGPAWANAVYIGDWRAP